MFHVTYLRQSRRVVIPATVATIAASVLLPLALHLLPPSQGAAWGARLLPIFYAPFLAAAFFRPGVSLAAAASAPLLNHLITGSPAAAITPILTLELVLFSALAVLLTRRFPRLPLAAPLAFLLAKGSAFIALSLLPSSWTPFEPGAYALSTTVNAWPGLVVLAVLSLLVASHLRRRPSGR